MSDPLSTVVVQDRLNTFGGGERVVKHLSDSVPGEVEIITGNYEPAGTYDFSEHTIKELDENSLLSFTRARLQIDWNQYDIAFLSGNRPQFLQLLELPIPTIRYCHSPTRTFWSLRDYHFRQADLIKKGMRLVAAPAYRNIDAYLNRKHDLIITNSQNIRSQVSRFYGLPATAVSPPVDVDTFEYTPHEGYWLSVNRLVPKKRVELQIESFIDLDETLVIVGSVDREFAEFGQQLKNRIENSDNIRLEESVSETRLQQLYAGAKGVLYTPLFEDFGIVPVEAMASGKPVVAVAEGGPLETVQNGHTGWLVEPTVSDIRDTVTADFNPDAFRVACQKQSQRYSTDQFENQIKHIVEEFD